MKIVNNLIGASLAKKLSEQWLASPELSLVITPDPLTTTQLIEVIGFFDDEIPCHTFPDWETLPYDILSPHQNVISHRIATLSRLLNQENHLLFVTIKTLMAYLCPKSYIGTQHLNFKVGDTLDRETFKQQCTNAGYHVVNNVIEPGECAFRGSIIDIFPTGLKKPLRIDLFDNEIDSIKTFDTESQRSIGTKEQINLLPAHEFPTDQAAISRFRKNWRERFPGSTKHCPIYRDVSQGLIPSGIEYYLPLFFDSCDTLFDYLPSSARLYLVNDLFETSDQFEQVLKIRYQQRSSDITRPILPVEQLFQPTDKVFAKLKQFERISLNQKPKEKYNAAVKKIEKIAIDRKSNEPLAKLIKFLNHNQSKSVNARGIGVRAYHNLDTKDFIRQLAIDLSIETGTTI